MSRSSTLLGSACCWSSYHLLPLNRSGLDPRLYSVPSKPNGWKKGTLIIIVLLLLIIIITITITIVTKGLLRNLVY